MIVTLQTERVQTLADVRAVIDGNDRLDYQFTDREAAYEFIRRTLVRFNYPTLSKPDKGVIGRYLAKMTGLSRAQMTRLVGQHRATGRVTDRRGGAPVRPFERRYTGADIRLLRRWTRLSATCPAPPRGRSCAVSSRSSASVALSAWRACPTATCTTCAGLAPTNANAPRSPRPGRRRSPLASAASPGPTGSPASYASTPFAVRCGQAHEAAAPWRLSSSLETRRQDADPERVQGAAETLPHHPHPRGERASTHPTSPKRPARQSGQIRCPQSVGSG